MRTEPWAVSDALWTRVEPLIPPSPSHAQGGRTRVPDRQIFSAIVYVLRTGIPWNALPSELGASTTVLSAGFTRPLSVTEPLSKKPATVAGEIGQPPEGSVGTACAWAV